jgi:hypothetical protein
MKTNNTEQKEVTSPFQKIINIGINSFNNSHLGIILTLLSHRLIDTFDTISLESRIIELENYAKNLNINPDTVEVIYQKPYTCMDGEIHFDSINSTLADLKNEVTKHCYIKPSEVTKTKATMELIASHHPQSAQPVQPKKTFP